MDKQNSAKIGGKTFARPWVRIGVTAIVVVLILVWQADLLVPKKDPGELAESPFDGEGLNVTKVKESFFPKQRRLMASVIPRAQIETAPQIGGTVEEVLVEADDRVKAGDLLLRIDPSSLRALRDEAKAALDKAEAARRGADRLLERVGQAVEVDALPETSRIEAEQAAETAARAVDQAAAALRQAEVKLGYAEIRSKKDAVIMERLLEPGDQAVPGRPAIISY
ncbi:MAG TPA: biotin/lipoyl-binding protein, partial [Opitutales bacterium]|nr:biotin/lipoyl-binding protein [Opitutales bacterium]